MPAKPWVPTSSSWYKFPFSCLLTVWRFGGIVPKLWYIGILFFVARLLPIEDLYYDLYHVYGKTDKNHKIGGGVLKGVKN